MEKQKGCFELSIDTKFLYDRMVRIGIGEVVMYSELSGLINGDVQGEARSNMNSARRRAASIDGIEFDTIRRVGLKRMSDREIARETGEHYIGGIRRKARRGMKVLGHIGDPSALANEDKIKMNTDASFLGVIGHMCKPKHLKRIEEAVREAVNKLPPLKTLELFRGHDTTEELK